MIIFIDLKGKCDFPIVIENWRQIKKWWKSHIMSDRNRGLNRRRLILQDHRVYRPVRMLPYINIFRFRGFELRIYNFKEEFSSWQVQLSGFRIGTLQAIPQMRTCRLLFCNIIAKLSGWKDFVSLYFSSLP